MNRLSKATGILTFMIMTGVCGIAVAADAEIGKPAPAFSLKDTQAEAVSLADYKGKIVVLEWTNHECPFVEKHYDSGNMQKLQKQYTDKGVVWLSVISSAPGEQGHVSSDQADRLTAERKASPSKVLFDPDGKVGKAYGAKTTPHMYVIDTKGVLQYMGAIDSIRSTDIADIEKAENYVDTALQSVLAGKSVENASTRPYGCGVKYKG